jgi:5'-deoxynucleotidase YfbR-like HD superfamily hydrolase
MSQVKFIRRGLQVNRFHTRATIKDNTVGHHTAGVALFCILLEEEPSIHLLKAALFHDLAEHEFGDVPSPTKNYLNVKEAFDKLEEDLLKQVGLDVGLTPEETRTLKIADCLDGMCFCLEEAELGNRQLLDVADRYYDYLSALRPWSEREEMVINEARRIHGS